MNKKEILDKIDKLASHDECYEYKDFMERYVSALCYESTKYWDEEPERLEALKQLYQVYKDCGGLDV